MDFVLGFPNQFLNLYVNNYVIIKVRVFLKDLEQMLWLLDMPSKSGFKLGPNKVWFKMPMLGFWNPQSHIICACPTPPLSAFKDEEKVIKPRSRRIRNEEPSVDRW